MFDHLPGPLHHQYSLIPFSKCLSILTLFTPMILWEYFSLGLLQSLHNCFSSILLWELELQCPMLHIATTVTNLYDHYSIQSFTHSFFLQWFPIIHKMEFKFLSMTFKTFYCRFGHNISLCHPPPWYTFLFLPLEVGRILPHFHLSLLLSFFKHQLKYCFLRKIFYLSGYLYCSVFLLSQNFIYTSL